MAMTSPIWGRAGNTTTNATRYMGLNNNYLATWQTTDALAAQVFSDTGTLQNWYITLNTAPTSGNSYTFTIVKNGTDTSMVVTIADTATTNSDTTHTLSIVAGDTLTIKCVPTGTPVAVQPNYALENVGNTQVMSSFPTVVSNATRYTGLMAGTANATANQTQNIISAAGNITSANALAQTAPGLTQTVTCTLVVNGSDSALVVTLSGTTPTASASTSVAVAAGDLVYWKLVSSLTSATGQMTIGTTFTPTTAGNSMWMTAPSAALTASGNNYSPIFSGGGGYSTTEANRAPYNTATTWTLKNLYVNLLTAPGAAASGKKYTATVRSNAANTAVTCDISETATTNSDTTHTATATATALLDVNFVGASTPATSIAQASFVTFLTPPAAGNPTLMMTGMGQ